MLNLYRRHQSPCRFASRRYRNCNCPIWVQGSLRNEVHPPGAQPAILVGGDGLGARLGSLWRNRHG